MGPSVQLIFSLGKMETHHKDQNNFFTNLRIDNFACYKNELKMNGISMLINFWRSFNISANALIAHLTGDPSAIEQLAGRTP